MKLDIRLFDGLPEAYNNLEKLENPLKYLQERMEGLGIEKFSIVCTDNVRKKYIEIVRSNPAKITALEMFLVYNRFDEHPASKYEFEMMVSRDKSKIMPTIQKFMIQNGIEEVKLIGAGLKAYKKKLLRSRNPKIMDAIDRL